MKKIYKLKQWYSLADAARRLSLTLGEEVTSDEILELALEGNIALFWYVRHVAAQEVVLEVRTLESLLSLNPGVENDNLVSNEPIEIYDYFPVENQPYVSILEGPHRLLINEIGALEDYLRAHLTNTGGDLISLDGFLVQDKSEKIWTILRPFESSDMEKIGHTERLHLHDKRRFYPSNEWPNISEIGFTKTELEKFENDLQNNKNNEIGTRERQTLYKLLIAMATDAYGYRPDELRSPFPKELEGILDRMGLSVSDDTIRAKLKDAAELLSNPTSQ